MANAEWQLCARRTRHVLEIDEYSLRGFGAQIARRRRVLGHALKGLEHEVELFDGRKVGFAANGAGDFMLGYKRRQRVVIHARYGHAQLVLGGVRLDEVVGAATAFARAAVHERVGKSAQMTGRLPSTSVHEYCAVQPEVVFALGHELAPPRFFDIVVQLHADGSVVPGVGEAAVNLAAREDYSARLAQRYQLVHCDFHCKLPSF